MSNTEPSDLRFWRALAEYLRHACALFGLPAQLAQRLWLSRAEHKRLTLFLRMLEDILRRLIFIAALSIEVRAPAERKRRPRRDMPAQFGASFDMTDPESWRASFKLGLPLDRRRLAGDRQCSGNRRAGEDAGGPSDQIPSAASALRLEALIRGFNTYERLAEALARKLARNARAAFAYIVPPPKRHANAPGYLTLAKLVPLAAEAHQAHLMGLLNSS